MKPVQHFHGEMLHSYLLKASLEILCMHTKDQVMHSNVSPPISAVYILTRFLLVQVWSIQIKEQSKTKKKRF